MQICFFRIQLEADTKISQDFVENFFQDRPVDGRFESIRYHSFHSVESLTNATQMTFNLPRFLGPNSYLPHKLLLKVQVKVIDVATGKVPVAAQQVAPANNILHSLFSSCRIWLGETLITKNPDNYAHRAYFIDLLSFDSMAKYSWLEAQGWYQDVFGTTLANQTTNNSGFNNRRGRFLLDPNVPASEFAPEGAIFMGRLHTDFVSAKCGLIPGLGMRIVLGYSPSTFVLQKKPPTLLHIKL